MQDINWNNFKAKFNGKEQHSFEHLCYLLFCDEFNQKAGIFRYKNQAGIETEPIQHDGRWIGFQSKFYETKIGDNKEDIKDSITIAKTKNPNLSKIFFYINQEFSESSKKDQKAPKYKIEIEYHAKSNGVEIEWRVPSHFEKQLTLEKNITLAQHFFCLDKSVIDFIAELNQHTESILAPIHSKIEFNGNEIKIDRTSILENLNNTLNQSSLVIISGEGGVGKTALIKDFYNGIKSTASFFVFKATEFNILNINDLFKSYGNFTLSDFIKGHQDIIEKDIVIDSAEKLSDIKNQEIFQEFITSIVESNWKILFTTRHGYLDDLKFQIIGVYRHSFQLLNIENLSKAELVELSRKYNFNLPRNERLLELLQNPFYLNEFLQNYKGISDTTNYSDFKNILWNKQILKSSYRKNNIHIKREKCFLGIAKRRADSGHFFVTADDCSDEILQNLEADEIIKYDSNACGYFITHDIYEEWALDRFIEISFLNSGNYKNFFDVIGSSLAIRRALRNWASEQLLIDENKVKSLIEESISDDKIESYWKDELLVSVLLSKYSEAFIQLFEKKLLEDNQKLLMRVVFLLRIACKEIDESLLSLLGLQRIDGITLKTLFTKPKGSGWNCVIDFIHKHKETFGLQNINMILPLLVDWNYKHKNGETTKKASQIALYYYEEIAKNGGFWHSSRDEKKEQLIRVILQGASENKEELKAIFDEVISKKLTNYRDKYYELIQTILTSITDSFEVVKNLPEYVIKLAELFWYQNPNEESDENYGNPRMGVEDYFCISSSHFEYYPSSAFQTPIYQLLRVSPQKTIDFILLFTNKTIECYLISKLKNEVEEVEVVINENENIKQYISARLWNMYRGTQGSTDLLESIHMALEKWLFEYAKTGKEEELRNLCSYLIKNSKSSSITAVVASVVLAYPSKLFDIAKILFQTKEFFIYDTSRMLLDQSARSQYSIGYGLNYQHKIYADERIKTCEDAHRNYSLEHIAVNYQFFRTKGESDHDANKRQRILWDIFDTYYERLPDKDKETDSDRTWRLYLARMDRRKMNPTVEEKDGQVLINFNPDIDPELKKHSEESLQISSAAMKYIPLHLWANYKFIGEEDEYKKYPKYENNPQLIILETKEIIEAIKNKTEDSFSLFNHSIPAYTCAVLVRDYFDNLNKIEKEFCKEVIIDFASIPLRENYQYQISDGSEPAIISLPYLIRIFPNETDDIKALLFLLLLNSWREISSFAIRSILDNLWEINFEDAHSIFLGYLFLKPKYNDIREQVRKENFKKRLYTISEDQILKIFLRRHKEELERIVSNKITYCDLGNLIDFDLKTLETAFELLPLRTKNEDHKEFINAIFPIFSKKLFINEDKVDYTLKQRFFEKLAYFILTLKKDEIEIYLRPFINNFSNSRDMANLFQKFISVEDRLNQYEEFWIVWNSFYEKIVETCRMESSYHYTKEIVHNYLLARPYWKENAKEWHTLKEREKKFFKKVAEDIGYHPSVLYSLSKILNDIGSNFIEDGILWISDILKKDANLFSGELEINTIYYIENIVRRYILKYRQKIKTIPKIKNEVIVILNFLTERGSVTGYLLREDIL